eukprot:7267915-Pyramimonas_sp.AAC.1
MTTTDSLCPKRFQEGATTCWPPIRLVGSAPLSSIRSLAFSQNKNNQKQGIKGQRVLHCCD